MRNNSYIIVDKFTGEGVLEFFDQKLIQKVNLKKYKVLPALDYLCQLNQKLGLIATLRSKL